jgi:hypothetical protein
VLDGLRAAGRAGRPGGQCASHGPPVPSGQRVAGRPRVTRPESVPPAAPAAPNAAGRAGYALRLVLPVIGPAGSCAGPTGFAATGLLVFGWLVRMLASTLLVIYALAVTGLTRRRPGPG